MIGDLNNFVHVKLSKMIADYMGVQIADFEFVELSFQMTHSLRSVPYENESQRHRHICRQFTLEVIPEEQSENEA